MLQGVRGARRGLQPALRSCRNPNTISKANIIKKNIRFSSTETKSDQKGGLGSHFGATHEHKDSILLKAFVSLGNVIENVTKAVSESKVGTVVTPKQEQKHMWGKAEKQELIIEEDEETGKKTVKSDKKKVESQKVDGVPINTEQFAVIPAGEVIDHTEKETAWSLFAALLTQQTYRNTQQQATDKLYSIVPDFSESDFLEDVESQLLPSFLSALWNKDNDALKSMCSDACYCLHVESHVKQYEKVESQCKLLMTRRADMFQRLMFIDDSDHAPSVKRRAELAEKGIEFSEDDDLDMEEEPEPIFFVSCSAHIINHWVDPKSKELKMGHPHEPEDWFFILGLTPQPGPKWILSSLEFKKMQAMSSATE